MASQKNEKRSVSTDERRLLKDFGLKLVELAARKKRSIERLAYEAGVSKGYLYDIVKGKGNPSLLIVIRLADALNVKPNTLI